MLTVTIDINDLGRRYRLELSRGAPGQPWCPLRVVRILPPDPPQTPEWHEGAPLVLHGAAAKRVLARARPLLPS